MKTPFFFFTPAVAGICLISVLLAGCGSGDGDGGGEAEAKASEAAATVYAVKGVFLEAKDGGKVVVIDHEEIPGYMMAMVMPFRTKEPEEVAGLEAGDEIAFEYHVEDLASWIENVQPTGKKVNLSEPENLPSRREKGALLEPGDALPDYEFANETGEWVKLSDYRGSVVALTFIFTRCPVPEYCPRMMRNFKEVSEVLEADTALGGDWKLLTISFDPAYDTPEVMANYGKLMGKASEDWELLTTDSCCTVNEIAENVGLKFGETESGSYQHNLRTVVLDQEGRIARLWTDENWEVGEMVREMKRLLDS